MQELAFSLLVEGRAVLVEVPEAGSESRHHATVLSASEGHALSVELHERRNPPIELPESARIIVPVGHRAWRFPVDLIRAATPDSARTIFRWPTTAEQVEARRSRRVTRVVGVKCRPTGSSASPWIATYTLDISDSGLRIGFPEAFDERSRLDLEIFLPDKCLRVDGAIAWRQTIAATEGDPMFAAGIHLDSLSESARFRLHALANQA